MSYLAPTKLSEAFDFLSETGARVIAGCTDYFPARQPDQIGESLLDITRLDGFRGITRTDTGWRMGAATTWTDILQAPLPPGFDGLKLAAHEVGSVQIQNRGTVAGNLCNASPAADGVPPLLTLDADVELTSATGTRRLPLSAFITGVRQTALQPNELVSALHIPDPQDATSAFLKLGSRTHLVISIVMTSALIRSKAGRITEAKLAVGSCSAVAQRLPTLEAALIGQTSDSLVSGFALPAGAFAPLTPISDVRGSAGFRQDAARILTLRCVQAALTGDQP